MAESEAQFERSVIELAELCGWKIYHTRNSKGSNPGWPDLTLTKPGILVFAELKAERGRVSPAQRAWLEALDRVSYNVLVKLWRPSDWPEIQALLQATGPERGLAMVLRG